MRRVVINTCIAGEGETLNVGQIVSLNDKTAARYVEKGFATYTELTKEEIKAAKEAELAENKVIQDLSAQKAELETKLAELETRATETLKENEALKSELEALKKGDKK